MTQAPERVEEPCLPHSLNVVNTYTEMTTWSGPVTVVIKNQTAVPINIGKGIEVAQLVAANRVPPVEVRPGALEKLDKIWRIRLSIKHRKEMLLQQLDLSGLEGWSSANCTSTHALLTKYHIFLLEPGELGCMDLAKHKIWIVDDEPFKERFWRIPPPIVEEVRAHVKEMLEAGAIYPSHSTWGKAVM